MNCFVEVGVFTHQITGNMIYEKLNPDLYAPPGTDAGDVDNLKWPMGLSFNRPGIKHAGFARQQNVNELTAATEMAGVDMHLEPNAYRELHWHQANEWSYIFNGSVRVGAVDEAGQTTYDDLNAGDVWFFPAGKPHTIQALEKGAEFLLVFDSGSFSEENTFLASELFLRTPKSVLAKNLKTDVSSFDNIPQDQLYIFPGTPPPAKLSAQNITGPAGSISTNPYTYHFSQQEPYVVDGGSVKILDPTTFPIAANFSVAYVTIQPGAMREIHWHTDSDEWNFFISGNARMSVFSAPTASRTFDFTEGDVGYIPFPDSHYIENTGDIDVVYLEVLQAPKFTGKSSHPEVLQMGLETDYCVIRYLSRSMVGLDTTASCQRYFESAGRGYRKSTQIQELHRSWEYEPDDDELHW